MFQYVALWRSDRIPLIKTPEKSTLLMKFGLFSFLVLGLSWIISAGYSVLADHIHIIMRSLFSEYSGESVARASLSSPGSSPLEKGLTIFSFFMIFFIGLLGFIRYITRERWRLDFVGMTVFFGVMTSVSMPIMNLNPEIAAFAVRTPQFLFLGLAPLFGYIVFAGVTNIRNKGLRRMLMILMLVCFSISVVDQMPRNYYFFSNEKATGQLWEVRNNSRSLYGSILWYSHYTPESSLAISDVPIHDIGAGMLNLSLTYYNDLYASPSKIDENLAKLREIAVNYVFINNLMSSYVEQWTYQVFTKPVPVSNLEFLSNNVTVFNMVYDNGIIQILYLHN
jgi:hypothetical protein